MPDFFFPHTYHSPPGPVRTVRDAGSQDSHSPVPCLPKVTGEGRTFLETTEQRLTLLGDTCANILRDQKETGCLGTLENFMKELTLLTA